MKQHRERNQHKTLIFGLVALGIFTLSAVLAVVGLGNSVGEIREAEIAKAPTALLASAGAQENREITLPVTYWDQWSDICVDLYDEKDRELLLLRQFEWSSCGYYGKKLEQGLAEAQLDDNGLPVANKGKLAPNRGVNFKRWFSEVEDESSEYNGTLQLRYNADGARFTFGADEFFPLDDAEFSADDEVNKDGHNHLFTMSFAVPFTVLRTGEETFGITADDDTFVYLNGQLVLDMGGIHRAMTGAVAIAENGMVYASVDGADWDNTGVTLDPGTLATLKVFHADRDSGESRIALEFAGMNLAIEEGTQIAANLTDSDDPTYVAPLGETREFEPDTTRSLLITATVEGATILAAAVLVTAVARFLVKQRVEK